MLTKCLFFTLYSVHISRLGKHGNQQIQLFIKKRNTNKFLYGLACHNRMPKGPVTKYIMYNHHTPNVNMVYVGVFMCNHTLFVPRICMLNLLKSLRSTDKTDYLMKDTTNFRSIF